MGKREERVSISHFQFLELILTSSTLSSVHLSSPSPATRSHALKLVTALAVQCSDPGPVEAMMSQLLTALKSQYM